jgi:hypothetical protein
LDKLPQIIENLSFCLSFILIIYYLYRKRFIGFGANPLFPFLLLIAIAAFYEIIGTGILKLDSGIFFKVYLFAEFFVLLFYFYKLTQKTIPYFAVISAILYLILFIYTIFACIAADWNFKVGLLTDAYLSAFEAIVVYSCAIYWFLRMFRLLPDTSLLKLPDFYFVSGLIMYVSGPLFLFLLSSQIMQADFTGFRVYWMINNVFNIILKLFLIIGVWKIKK